MAEAALLALDLLLVAYTCWIVLRASKKPKVTSKDLSIFAYKEREDEA